MNEEDVITREAKTYTVEEIVDMLGVGERTIYKYIKEKRLKAVKIGREWRIRHVDYVEFLENSESNM